MLNQFLVQLAAKAAISLALALAAAWDWRHGSVPNALTLPLLAMATLLAGLRLARGDLTPGAAGLLVASWAIGLGLWWLRVFGGGDVKLALALVSLFPDMRLLVLLLACLLVGLVTVLLRYEGRAGLRRLSWLAYSAAQGGLPTRAEIAEAYQTRGRRVTYLISLAGLLYIWLLPIVG